MKLKDAFISLVLISLLLNIYYSYTSLSYLRNVLENIFHQPMQIFQLISSLVGIVFIIIAIVGIVQYFNDKIYNKFLKIYLLEFCLSIILGIPSTIYFRFFYDSGSGAISRLWYQDLFWILNIALVTVAIIFYRRQPIFTLPAPVKNKGIRFAHYVIDTLFIYFVLFGQISWMFTFFIYDLNETAITIGIYAVSFFIYFIYYFVSEIGFGQTVGKIITGTYVRSSNSQKASGLSVVGRTLCRFIPFEAFSFLPEPTNGWHDSISKTNVFYKSKLSPDEAQEHHNDILDAPISEGINDGFGSDIKS